MEVHKSLFTRISEANIMSDGMLKEVNYGDLALITVIKDKPEELKNIYNKHNR